MTNSRVLSGIGIAVTASIILLYWLGPERLWPESTASSSGNPASRTYTETGSFDEPCTRSREGRQFECSDGSKLYVITERLQTEAAANEVVARRWRMATSIDVAASSGSHSAFGYKTTSDVAFELPRCFSSQTFAAVWARGNCVVGIYGPSLGHVRELEGLFHPV